MADQNNTGNLIGRYAGLPITFLLCLFIGYAIGYYLDRAFGTHYLYLVFLLFGVAAGLLTVVRQILKDNGASRS